MADENGNTLAERQLPRDEFTARRRQLEGHPEVVKASSRIDVEDDYGSITTWVVDQYRWDGDVYALVQCGSAGGYVRVVLPPEVTAAISRGQAGLVTKNRKRIARRVVADKRASGQKLGNPEALAAARLYRVEQADRKRQRDREEKRGRR